MIVEVAVDDELSLVSEKEVAAAKQNRIAIREKADLRVCRNLRSALARRTITSIFKFGCAKITRHYSSSNDPSRAGGDLSRSSCRKSHWSTPIDTFL